MTIALVILTACLLAAYGGLMVYYRNYWNSIPEFRLKENTLSPSTMISVIVPARNEEENIAGLILSLVQQDYPHELFEVIVVDDFSTDQTAAIVRKSPRIQLLQLKDFIEVDQLNSYKKKAIEIGIRHSQGELIVTTDADCYMPARWLTTIAAFYEKHKPELIAMPVAIDCSNKPLEIFQALDFMALQGITGAAVLSRQHSMCNGANLAYTRRAFDAVDGFKDIDRIASGDDMLPMHKIALRFPDRIQYLKSRDVIVETMPVNSVKDFFNQRVRWASKADQYDDKSIFWVLLLVYLLNVFLAALPLISLFTKDRQLFNYWLILLAVKTLSEIFFLIPVSRFFHKAGLLFVFPLAQPFHVLYTVIAGWLGKFGSYEWKSRTVK